MMTTLPLDDLNSELWPKQRVSVTTCLVSLCVFSLPADRGSSHCSRLNNKFPACWPGWGTHSRLSNSKRLPGSQWWGSSYTTENNSRSCPLHTSHLSQITWVLAKLMAMPIIVEIAWVMENIFPRWVLGTHLDRRDKAGDPLLPLTKYLIFY